MPDAFISVSWEVLPEFREFERLSTTVLNAEVGPRMGIYLDRFFRPLVGARAPGRTPSIRMAG